MKLTGTGVVALAGVLAVAGGAAWLFWKFGRNALNPLSRENAAYVSAGAVVETLTGGHESSVGGLLARWFADNDDEIEAMKQGAAGRTHTTPTDDGIGRSILGMGA